MQNKDAIIEKQQQYIKLLEEKIHSMELYIAKLEEKIARLEKNSNNSSKPPSSDIVKPNKTVVKVSRRKRKRGGQHGHRKFSRPSFKPEEVDEVIEYEIKDKDAVGLEPLDAWFVIQ